MNTELIIILMYINDSRMRNHCVKISQNRICSDISCNNCPLFYEPEYLFVLDSTRESIDE